MNQSKIIRRVLLFAAASGLLTFFISTGLSAARLAANWQVKTQIQSPLPVTALAFSPHGTQIVTGHNSGQLNVWDAATGKLIQSSNTRAKAIDALLFTPDEHRLIAITADNKAQILSFPDLRPVGSITGITATADISPDGKWLAGQDPDHKLWLWDLSTLKRDRQIGNTGTDGALGISFTPDGKHLAVAYDYNPYLIDVQSKTATKLSIMAKPSMSVNPIDKNKATITMGPMGDEQAFCHFARASKTGTLLVIGRGIFGKPDFVDIYDWKEMKSVARIKPNDDGTVACFSSDNALVAIQGKGQVTAWEIATGQQVAKIKASGVAPSSLIAKGSHLFEFSPVARELAVVDGDSLLIYQER